MEIDKSTLCDHYSSLTDDALLELSSDDGLIDEAREVLNEELQTRGIPLNSVDQPDFVTVKDIDRSVLKQRGSRALWRIFWRTVFPFIALVILIYITQFDDWIRGG